MVTTQVSYRLTKGEEINESTLMTKEEELQALREENHILKALVAELLPLKEQLAQATARIEERLAPTVERIADLLVASGKAVV